MLCLQRPPYALLVTLSCMLHALFKCAVFAQGTAEADNVLVRKTFVAFISDPAADAERTDCTVTSPSPYQRFEFAANTAFGQIILNAGGTAATVNGTDIFNFDGELHVQHTLYCVEVAVSHVLHSVHHAAYTEYKSS